MRKTTLSAVLFLVFSLCISGAIAQATRTAAKRSTTKRVVAAVTREQVTIPDEEFPLPASVEDAMIPEPGTKPETTWPWPQSPETVKLNSGKCESYPWLSADGLRIYFTSNRDGGHGNIYYTERKSVNDQFGKTEKVFKNKDNIYYAAALTNDELTMYVTLQGYHLFIATRNSTGEAFGAPKKIAELGDRQLYAPGISPDGNEMVIIDYVSGSRTNAAWFMKNKEGKFEEKGILELPGDMVPGPGQMGKDGLTYYCSLKKKDESREDLYCFTRSALGEPFKLAYRLPDEVNVTRGSLQPSVNGDGSLLLYCINNDGGWDGDDLRLVNLQKGGKVQEIAPGEFVAVKQTPVSLTTAAIQPKITVQPANVLASNLNIISKTSAPADIVVKAAAVNIYPNPFKDQFTVELLKPVNGKLLVELFDANGKRVVAQQINGADITTQIKTGTVLAGQYTVRISNTDAVIYSGIVIAGK